MSTFGTKQRKLVDLLIKKTAESSLPWELGLGGKSAITNLTSGHVELKSDTDENGQEAVRVTLFDKSGNEISSFDDTDLTYTDDFTEAIVSYYARMEELLSEAFRIARGEGIIIDAFLEELEHDPDADW